MNSPSASDASTPPASHQRTLLGGFLMGLANLVPGVSGGTMILAVGLYERFIGAVADVTKLRLTRPTLLFLAVFGVGLVVAVLGLSGPAVWLTTHHRWVAYSVFIGLTLGGVPLLVRGVRPFGPGVVAGVLAGLALMAGVAFGLRDTALPHTVPVFTGIGALAASSMILPGISGSYVLLIFGLYDVIIGSLRPDVLLEEPGEALGIIVPVGIGVVLGIGLLSNVLKWLLARHERGTHAVLLGLLLGSVLGLYPFQRAVHPELVTKDGVKGVEALLAGASLEAVDADFGLLLEPARAAELRTLHAGSTRGDLKLLGLQLQTYAPGAGEVGVALLCVLAGFLATRRLGQE